MPQSDTGQYKNPPLVEAVCSFKFGGEQTWNGTIPGLLYAELRDGYPEQPEQRMIFQANLFPADSGQAAQTQQQVVTAFRNGSKVLSVGPDLLSVHSLKPYEGWDSLKARTSRAYEAYCKVGTPNTVENVGVRYINQVMVPSGPVRLEDYFTVTQVLPMDGFGGTTLSSFFDRTELVYEDIPATIAFTWASAESERPDSSAFVLDFDMAWKEESSIDDALGHLEVLHQRAQAAFESLIRDSLRESFDSD